MVRESEKIWHKQQNDIYGIAAGNKRIEGNV